MASPSPLAPGPRPDDGPPAPTHRGARTSRALVVVGAMLALTLGLSLLTAPDTPVPRAVALPQPGPHLGLSLVDRGWALDDDGAPPVGVDGMRLTDSVEIGFEERTGWLRLGAGWSTGGTRWAVLWCDLPRVEDPVVRQPALALAFDEGEVALPCAARDGAPAVTRLVPLPPAGPLDHPTPGFVWDGDLPKEGSATLGIYLELYGAPLRSGRPLTPPAAPPGSVALDSTTSTVRHGGRRVRVEMVQLRPDSRLELWAGGPGLLRVAVDGEVVTDDGDLGDEPGWADQDPDLRDGYWHAGRAGTTRRLALPPEVLPAAGQTRTVVVSVADDAALPGAWSVHVAPAEAVAPRGAALASPVPDDLPVVPGLAPAGAWRVPADGHPHHLPLPTEAAGKGEDPWSWKFVVLSDDTGPGVPATLTSPDRVRPFARVGTDALTTGHELADTLLRQRDQTRPPPESAGPLAVTLAPSPGQPMLQVLAFRPAQG